MPQVQPEDGLVGRTLGSYRVLESLGSGGMGEVYLAEHGPLRRRVALKVLPREMASHPEKILRFEREARAVASLSHPGIVVLYSIEEADGRRFLAMEHVEGETLSRAIPQRGFPLERLLPLAIELTDAVAAAHRKGILHRDLKPENVMLTAEGRVKVLDFGLAKLRDDEPEPDQTARETQSVTQDGRIVGTVAYMSPEQAQGLPVDHRSDIFSLGILLYELSSGERPFQGNTNLSVLSSILKDTPRPLSELREDVPRPLARMVQRCLEKRVEDRYQSASDLRRDLEDLKRDLDTGELLLATTAGRARLLSSGSASRLLAAGARRRWALPAVVAAAVLLVALAGAAVFLRGRAPAAAADGRRSLAVFYFDNLSGDPRLDWLRTGLTDMLVTNLSQSPGVRVLGTGRLYQLLEEAGHRDERSVSAATVDVVSRRAQASTALVGSFVRAGSQIRIQASLQDPRTGELIASERVEGDAEGGLFQLVDELTGRLRRRLELPGMRLGRRERGIEEVATASLDAYKAYAEGSRLHDRLQEREAQGYFERAVAADPGFAMALAKLSIVHGNLGNEEKAREYSARAVEKAAALPDGERFYIEGRHHSLDPATKEQAIAAYAKAVDAAPDNTAARNNLAQLLLEFRRYPEAIAHLEELQRRGMTFPGSYMSLADAYVATGRAERARETLAGYVREHPDRAAGYENLGYLQLAQGQLAEALASFDKATTLGTDAAMKVEKGRFLALALQDRWPEAEAAAARLAGVEDPASRWDGHAALAIASLYRGDAAAARRIAAEGAKSGATAEERVGARLFAAQLESELGRPEAALEAADRALADAAKQPKLRAESQGMRAVCLARLGRAAEAETSAAEAERWLETIPRASGEPSRLHLRGQLALARGDATRAIPLLQKAAELQPAHGIDIGAEPVEIQWALARAALQAGPADEARRALARVVDGGPGRVFSPIPYVRSLVLLAALEEKGGRPAEARALYERYLRCWKDGRIDRAEVARASQRLAALARGASA